MGWGEMGVEREGRGVEDGNKSEGERGRVLMTTTKNSNFISVLYTYICQEMYQLMLEHKWVKLMELIEAECSMKLHPTCTLTMV